MKGKISIVVLIGFAISLCALTAWAQAEKSEPQLWYFGHNVVKPSMMNKLQRYIKEMVGYSKEYNYQYPWYTLITDDYQIYFAIPIKDKNEIDNIFITWGELAEKVGQPWQEMMKDYWGCYDSVDSFLIRHRPDLSFNPEKEEGEHEDMNFFAWHIDYIKPGKQFDYEGIHKEWVAMNKRNSSPNAYNVFAGELGLEGPVYIGMARGKNIQGWYTQYYKFWKMAGEEGQERNMRRRELIRKHETKHIWYRPDLSYDIEKK
jgi:hypothetical protein